MPISSSPQFGETSDDIDLGDIARFVRRQWKQIAYVSAAATLIALYLVLSARPSFSLNGSLYFGDTPPQNPAGSGGANLLTNFQNNNDVPTEVALIQSRALVEQAILETGLNVTSHRVGTGAMTYWQWRFEDREAIDAYAPKPDDLTILYATLFDPGSGGGSYELKFGSGGAYQLFPAGGEGPAILNGSLNQPAAGGGLTMLVKLATDAPAPPAGSDYEVKITPAKSLAEALIGRRLTVVQGGQSATPTQTADINFSWDNPYTGQIFLNQLMKDFIATQLSWKTESASDTQQFIAQQLDHVKSSLADADNRLASYQAKTGLVDVSANAQAVINQLSQYEVQRTTAMLQEQSLQQLAASTSHGGPGVNPYLITQSNDPVLAQLAGNLATAQVQLRTQSLQFTPSSPELEAQEETVSRTEEAIRSLLKNDEALAKGNVANLDALIAKYQAQLRSMPAQSLQISELTRASDVFGQLYVLLMQDEEDAEVSKAATILNTRIVSPAEVPLSATSPKGMITVLSGLTLGLLLGTMAVLAQRVLSGRFHSESDVQRSYHIPVYGLIPGRSKAEILAGTFPLGLSNAFAEAFRLLRSRVYQSVSTTPQRAVTILMTSAEERDGKTTTAIHLAKSIADDGKRVLLVDGDLYRGHLHEALRLRQSPGLSERLAGQDVAPPQLVPGQGFWALAAGSYVANPAGLLKESTLAGMFEPLVRDFDYIIVDCPPLPSVVDTITFAKSADLILSIIYLEKTSRAAFNAHNETLNTLSVPRGIVINGLTGGPHYRTRAYSDTSFELSGWRRFIGWRAHQS